MPTIAIDASSTQKVPRTGVEEYSFQIIEGLKNLVSEETKLVLYYQNKLPDFFVFHQVGISGLVLNWPFKRFWMQLRVAWELLRRPPNIFFVPGQALPFFVSRKIKVATTIHDIGFARRPDLYLPAEVGRQTMVTKRAVKRADIIFTPSEFTKKELVEVFRAKPEKIVVTPLSADSGKYKPMSRETAEAVLDKYRLSYKNYFLFVGRVDVKKNPAVLFSAFEELKKNMGQGDPLRLVLAGPAGYRFAELKQLAAKSSFQDFISFLDFVPAEDLPTLICSARALVSPTWYEGFNIPLVQAAACGTPLIVSDIPINHEVMGSAALFVPPGEPEKWAMALNTTIHEPVTTSRLSDLGLEQAKNFSWEATCKKTLDALLKL